MDESAVAKKPTNIKKVGTFYLIGTLFNKGVAFLTVPIFTRILSTSEYGIVTTYNSWVGIIAMVIGLAMHMSVRSAFVDYKMKIYDYTFTVVSFTILNALLASAIISVGTILLQLNINLVMIILCIVQGASSAIIEDCSVLLMMQYRFKGRTALLVLPNSLSTIFSILAIMFVVETNKYWGRIIPTALTFLIIAIVVYMFLVFKKSEHFNLGMLKYGIKFSAPLILHGIALNILSQSDRTMITVFQNPSQTGIYSLVFNFSMIATVLTSSLEGVWIPWFTEKLNNKNRREINALAKDYITLMAFLMSGLILVGPEILKLLADQSYWEGIVIIPPIVVANFVIYSYTLYVNIEHYYKKTAVISRNTIIAAIVNLVLNYLLIPHFGYIAAAYTTLTAYFLCFLLHAKAAKKLEPELYPIKFFSKAFAYIGLNIVVFYILKDHVILRWIYTVLYALIIFWSERYRIRKYINIKSNH